MALTGELSSSFQQHVQATGLSEAVLDHQGVCARLQAIADYTAHLELLRHRIARGYAAIDNIRPNTWPEYPQLVSLQHEKAAV